MNEDFVENRRRALEDSFFVKENARLINKIREKNNQEKQKHILSEVSGISDESILDTLIKLGITGETIAAMSLAPMILVAWADGKIDPKEKDAVMKAVIDAGISPTSSAVELVSNWLVQRPENSLEDAWKSYVKALKTEIGDSAFGQLKSDILGRAHKVAESAGGYLGLASVSAEEQEVLKRLQSAFE